jgi:hypothetical protein
MSIPYSATVLGGYFPENGVATLTNATTRGSRRRAAAQALDGKGTFDIRARMTALDGVAPGATAAKTFMVVEANVELGGLRAITTETLINRATTSGDVTIIEATVNTMSSKTTFGASPPANLDGNPLGTR